MPRDDSDVILLSNDGKFYSAHQRILSKYSVIFEKMFKESNEIPFTINMEKFDIETIKSAMQFCYGKMDAVAVENANKVLQFADAYSITELKQFIVEKFQR
uniref:BTB domain-containing protein n=1 Tax=Panagrolaimus davidi TaxID=227884 RepID=A0A914QZN7_9BILA